MEAHSHLSEKQVELLMEFADESFDLKRAVEFELASREYPELIEWAMINREIRQKLGRLPKISAGTGFLERLQSSIREQFPTA
ncbi:MAG: hypothetical protein WEA36_02390 [Balneolaceae bacterium]